MVAMLGLALCPACRRAPALDGMWDATVAVGSARVPFRFAIAGRGAGMQGSFFNGDQPITSTSVRFESNAIVFTYPQYAGELEFTLSPERPDHLTGNYFRAAGPTYGFEARRFTAAPEPRDVPQIGGLWTVAVPSTKGERAWRLIVRQSGAQVSAAILRVDGDSGAVTGAYDGHTFVLGHFSGTRPLRLELTPRDDGALTVQVDSYDTYTARRAEEARARGLPEPADPSRYSSLTDPGLPFVFKFPDLEGRLVSNADRRFSRKVVIVTIGGSWCPNCHDEAPFLMELYRKYRERGLEIVFLAFEETPQLKNLERLRAFIGRYHVEYTVLVAGDTRLARATLPQIVNLEAFPTTLYLGRDGLVRSVRTGFASAATGPFNTSLKEEITATIERLLAEP
jgi:thiol-disulfide isomerase/thioredoxin